MRFYLLFFFLWTVHIQANSRLQRQHGPDKKESMNPIPSQEIWSKSSYAFGISLDLILWVAKQDVNLATVGAYPLEATSVGQTGLIYPKFYLRPGFKIGIESFSTVYNWDFLIQYIWFSNDHNPSKPFYHYGPYHTSYVILPAWQVSPFWLGDRESRFGQDISLDNVSQVASAWSSLFNRLNVIFGRSFFVGRSFITKEMIGLSGFLLSQTFHVNSMNKVFVPPDGLFDTGSTDVYLPFLESEQKSGGFGPYVQEEVEYCFVEGKNYRFGLFSNFGIALFWSRMDASWKMHGNVSSESIPNYLMVNVKNRVWTVTPMLEILLGVRLQTVLQDSYIFGVQVGWELSSWFDQNYIFTTPWRRGPGTSNALYTMQGLTAKIKFSF